MLARCRFRVGGGAALGHAQGPFDGFEVHRSDIRVFPGLLRVAEHFADLRLVNEGTIEQFHTQINAILSGTPNVAGVTISGPQGKTLEANQLLRCLRALDSAGRPMSTDEIERETETTGSRIRHNNANKVLKKVPELARRLVLEGTRVRYEIMNAGRAYLRYMQKHDGLRFL